jgi:hypothetical protein
VKEQSDERIDHESDHDKVVGREFQAALKHGYSVLMEQADESGKVGIVIQDGEVVAVNEGVSA